MTERIDVGLEAVIVAVSDERPRILTLELEDRGRTLASLPSGLLEERDATLDKGVRRWVAGQTGLELAYVEQLYTFGDRFRDVGTRAGGARRLSVAYLALVPELQPSPGATWQDWYSFFPWEDHRAGPPASLAAVTESMERWVGTSPTAARRELREERTQIAFGLGGAQWDPVRVLERYELLYEARLLPESRFDDPDAVDEGPVVPGEPMVLDHRRIAASALGRLRGKLTYRPVVFELLAESFTLLQLQGLVEALSGTRLHKQNFRRLVDRAGLVEGTGAHTETGGRPAELFRFRREALRERSRSGVAIPDRRRR